MKKHELKTTNGNGWVFIECRYCYSFWFAKFEDMNIKVQEVKKFEDCDEAYSRYVIKRLQQGKEKITRQLKEIKDWVLR